MRCEERNSIGINICLRCYTNYARGIIQGLSFIPMIGLPFSITHATLKTDRTVHTKERLDKDSTEFAIGTAPLFNTVRSYLLNNL